MAYRRWLECDFYIYADVIFHERYGEPSLCVIGSKDSGKHYLALPLSVCRRGKAEEMLREQCPGYDECEYAEAMKAIGEFVSEHQQPGDAGEE